MCTEANKDIVLNAFIYDVRSTDYKALAVIKPVSGFFGEDQRENIKNIISRRPAVQHCAVAKLDHAYEMESDYFLILDLAVRDEYSPWGSIRPLQFFGDIPRRDIGHRSKEGWEEVYGLFRSQAEYDDCLRYMTNIYKDLLDKKGSELAKSPGLQLDPPLLLESIACGEVKFQEYRTCIDMALRRGIIPSQVQDNWTEIVGKHVDEAMKVARKIPPSVWLLLVKYVFFLITGRLVDPSDRDQTPS